MRHLEIFIPEIGTWQLMYTFHKMLYAQIRANCRVFIQHKRERARAERPNPTPEAHIYSTNASFRKAPYSVWVAAKDLDGNKILSPSCYQHPPIEEHGIDSAWLFPPANISPCDSIETDSTVENYQLDSVCYQLDCSYCPHEWWNGVAMISSVLANCNYTSLVATVSVQECGLWKTGSFAE